MTTLLGNYLFDLFLSSHDVDREDGWLILGYALFRIGVGVGLLYVVEYFPLITSIEKVTCISTLLLGGGAILLFLRGNKLLT